MHLSALKVCREKILSVHSEKMSFTYEYNGESNAENFRISPRKSWQSLDIFGSLA